MTLYHNRIKYRRKGKPNRRRETVGKAVPCACLFSLDNEAEHHGAADTGNLVQRDGGKL